MFALCHNVGTMAKSFYTYLHRRNDTGEVFYVGKGTRQRSRVRCGRNSHWQHVANKYGFTVEIVAKWNSELDAFEHEIFLIDTFRSLGAPLVNKSLGGEGAAGVVVSEETRRKHREAWVKTRDSDPSFDRRRLDALREAVSRPEHRELARRNSKRHRGDPAARKRQSEVSRNAWADPVQRSKRIAAMKEAAARPEVRELLAQVSRERVKNQDSVDRSTAYMRKLNIANRKPVVCLNNGREFESSKHAAAALGLNAHCVKEVCLGYYTHTRGFRFKYKCDTISRELESLPPPDSAASLQQ